MSSRVKLSYHQRNHISSDQKWRCAMCGELLPGVIEHDHIIPLWMNGTNEKANFQALDPTCHAHKTAMEQIRRTEWIRAGRPPFPKLTGKAAEEQRKRHMEWVMSIRSLFPEPEEEANPFPEAEVAPTAEELRDQHIEQLVHFFQHGDDEHEVYLDPQSSVYLSDLKQIMPVGDIAIRQIAMDRVGLVQKKTHICKTCGGQALKSLCGDHWHERNRAKRNVVYGIYIGRRQ